MSGRPALRREAWIWGVGVVLEAGVCLTASANPQINLINTSLSVTRASDGQTLTLGYRISCSQPTFARLGAILTGPPGSPSPTVEDKYHEDVVLLATGTR